MYTAVVGYSSPLNQLKKALMHDDLIYCWFYDKTSTFGNHLIHSSARRKLRLTVIIIIYIYKIDNQWENFNVLSFMDIFAISQGP